MCTSDKDPITSFMRPAPIPNDDETGLRETNIVLDPLSDEFLDLWNGTAAQNSQVYHELWKPVPSNDVTSWSIFKVRDSGVMLAASHSYFGTRATFPKSSLVTWRMNRYVFIRIFDHTMTEPEIRCRSSISRASSNPFAATLSKPSLTF